MLLEEQPYKGNAPMTAYTREYTGAFKPIFRIQRFITKSGAKKMGCN